MTKLEDLKNSHYYGSMIYVPINNSIYCLGGNNSKKCEIYRNDEILYSNFTHDIISDSKQWTIIPDMNFVRQEFSTVLFNSYLYAFFGHSSTTNCNINTLERINVVKNEKWM